MKKFLLFSLLLVCCGAPLIFIGCNEETANVTMSQVGEEQKIEIDFSNEPNVKEIEIVVYHGNDEISNTIITDEEELNQKTTQIDAFYGRQTITVNIINNDGSRSTKTSEICVSASEYNIAPLSGSMPVLLFTLQILQDDDINQYPTFVWLDRSGAWNWDNLPENVYPLPTATEEEITTPNVNRNLMYNKTNEYIKELASINKESKFNLYLNDYDTDQFMHMVVANNILDRATCTYLSDGAFSYAQINNVFNVENATEKYQQMAEDYRETKSQVEDRGYYSWDSGFNINGQDLRPYLLVIAHEEDNVNWVFPRLRTEHILIDNDTTDFVKNYVIDTTNGTQYGKGLKEVGINTLLTSIQDDENKVSQLKLLYKFNDDMFEEAMSNDKKVMMLLGTWLSIEQDFETYTEITKLLYGDEFVYYYKGHPNSPTEMYPEKAEQLEELGLIDIESTINAELILFFFPDIYMSGYTSSTFNSIQNPEMACIFWGATKEQALSTSDQNGDMFDYYASKLSNEDATYGHLLENQDHTYFLIETNDSLEIEYEFAIYDSTDNSIKYYNDSQIEL